MIIPKEGNKFLYSFNGKDLYIGKMIDSKYFDDISSINPLYILSNMCLFSDIFDDDIYLFKKFKQMTLISLGKNIPNI